MAMTRYVTFGISMPVLGISIMPDPSTKRVCPAATATAIAAVPSRTHAIVDPFRCVRSGGGMGTFVALTLVSEERDWCCGCMYNGCTEACSLGV
eukprot:4792452-Pleurochrysis_carterae.AAC.1